MYSGTLPYGHFGIKYGHLIIMALFFGLVKWPYSFL